MADAFYTQYFSDAIDGTIDVIVDGIQAVLLKSTYTFADTHTTLADINASHRLGTATLSGKTNTDGVFDANDPTFSSVTGTGVAVALYKAGETEASTRLICFVEIPSTTATAEDFTVQWSADGIFRFSNGFVVLTGASTSTSSGGWRTVYSVDFKTLTPKDLTTAGDGVAQDIGDGSGAVWKTVGAASATTLDLSAADGLDFLSSTSAEIYLYVPVQSIAPNFSTGDDWRLVVAYENYDANQQFENAVIGVTQTATGAGSGSNRAYGMSRGFTGSNDRLNLSYGTAEQGNLDIPDGSGGSPDFTAMDALMVGWEAGHVVFRGAVLGGEIPATTRDWFWIASYEPPAKFDVRPFDNSAGSFGMNIRLGINNSVSANRLSISQLQLQTRDPGS